MNMRLFLNILLVASGAFLAQVRFLRSEATLQLEITTRLSVRPFDSKKLNGIKIGTSFFCNSNLPVADMKFYLYPSALKLFGIRGKKRGKILSF